MRAFPEDRTHEKWIYSKVIRSWTIDCGNVVVINPNIRQTIPGSIPSQQSHLQIIHLLGLGSTASTSIYSQAQILYIALRGRTASTIEKSNSIQCLFW